MNKLNVLEAPSKPKNIPQDSQWLSGEGAGSWFSIALENDDYLIYRFSPEGKIECSGKFELVGNSLFQLNNQYQFTYLSHCAQIKIIQNNIIYTFLKKTNS